MIRKWVKGVLKEIANEPPDYPRANPAIETMMDQYGMTAMRVFKCSNGFLIRIEGTSSMTFCEKVEDVIGIYVASEAQRKLGVHGKVAQGSFGGDATSGYR
jgi:hypothetical protein